MLARSSGMQVMYKLLSSVLLCRMLSSEAVKIPKNSMTLKIETLLSKRLNPTHLDIINESFAHSGLRYSKDNHELASHYKIVVVSPLFQDKSYINCHRLVQEALKEGGIYDEVHAIQIITKTPENWEKCQQVPDAPKCMGGDGSRKKTA